MKRLLLFALGCLLPAIAGASAPLTGSGGSYYTTDLTPLTSGSLNPPRLDAAGQTLVSSLYPLQTQAVGTDLDVVVPLTNSTLAYVTGYVVGGVLTLGWVTRTNISASRLVDVKLVIAKADASTYTLYLFDHYPTWSTFNDHATPVINSADWNGLIDVISLTSPNSGLGVHTFYENRVLGEILTPAESRNLFGVLTVTGTPTFANTQSLQITLGFSQD